MVKKTTLIQILLLSSSLVFILCGCSPQNTAQKSSDCNKKQYSCLTLSFTESEARFDHNLILSEQVYNVTFSSRKPIKEVWLEAQNMQMGNIVLFLKEVQQYQYSTKLIIGLCAKPVMEWVMYIRFEDGTVDQQPFTSYWSADYQQSN